MYVHTLYMYEIHLYISGTTLAGFKLYAHRKIKDSMCYVDIFYQKLVWNFQTI